MVLAPSAPKPIIFDIHGISCFSIVAVIKPNKPLAVASVTSNNAKKLSLTASKFFYASLTTIQICLIHDMSVDSSTIKLKYIVFIFSINSSLLSAPKTFFTTAVVLVREQVMWVA